MTQPATAFGPGSPAGGPSITAEAIKKSIGGLIGGGIGGGLSIPGFTSSSSARSGDAMQGGSSTGDGFSVNYGHGATVGGGIPMWVWIAGAVGAGVWLWKKRSS